MKKFKVKEIITETVIGFLNEDKKERQFTPPQRIPVSGGGEEEKPIPIKIKNKINPKIHPIYSKPQKEFQPNPPNLNESLPDAEKKKIGEVVKKSLKRNGLLAFTYGTDEKEGKTTVGIRVDPTAKGDWILSKEELIYEMRIKYNNNLHSFVRVLREQLEKNK